MFPNPAPAGLPHPGALIFLKSQAYHLIPLLKILKFKLCSRLCRVVCDRPSLPAHFLTSASLTEPIHSHQTGLCYTYFLCQNAHHHLHPENALPFKSKLKNHLLVEASGYFLSGLWHSVRPFTIVIIIIGNCNDRFKHLFPGAGLSAVD